MKKIIFVSLLVIIGILFAGQIKRGFLSALILVDTVRPPEKALMWRFIPPPAVKTVSIPSRGRDLKADIYVPRSKGSAVPLLLVHGVNPTGKDDAQLVLLAGNLARAGFLVLVPDFAGMKDLRMRRSDVEDIVRSYRYLTGLQIARPGGVMMGISYGVGPLLFAAADSRIRDRASLVVSFGGYGDLRAVLQFLMTGYYDYGGASGYLRPLEALRWMFVYKNLDFLSSTADRKTLREIIERRNRYELASAAALAGTLGPEGRAVYAFLSNTDPKQFGPLFERLPASLRDYVAALSPAKIVKDIKADFIIVHGMEDYSIPYTESIRLAEAVAEGRQVRLALLSHFMHIEPVEQSAADLVERYAVGGWRLFKVIYALLRVQ